MWSAQDQKRNYVLVNTAWTVKVTTKKKKKKAQTSEELFDNGSH